MDSRSRSLDRQSLAFRDNPHPTADEDLDMLAERVHRPLTSIGRLLLPDDWEAVHWDSGRIEPKTLEEAQHALAERIADPHAPDGPEVVGAYDGLDL